VFDLCVVNGARARLGAAALGLTGVVFALIQILERTIGAFNPRPVASLLVASTVGVAGLTLERARHLAARRRFLTSLLYAWPLETVSRTDPLVLGIFPPRSSAGEDGIGPYVPRSVDDAFEEALQTGGLVLVVGRERAGKSRTAYEAARRSRSSDPLVVPVNGSALASLIEDGFDPSNEAVWWLDDLERFLPHLEGSDLAEFAVGRTVVVTIREEPWRTLLRASGESGHQGRRLLAAARAIHLPLKPDPTEVAAAARLYPDVDVSEGIGDALAAGDGSTSPLRAHEPSASSGRRIDPVLGLGLGATIALAALLGVVVLAGGFSTHPPPPIGAQLDAIRAQVARSGAAAVFEQSARFHGTGHTSHVFTVRPPEGNGSDELRIYDEVNGRLRERFSFRPRTHGEGGSDLGVPASVQEHDAPIDYELEDPTVADLNADGDAELTADYFLPNSGIRVRLPIVVVWDDRAQRYVLSPLLPKALPSVGSDMRLDDYARGLYSLVDQRTHEHISARAVSYYLLSPPAAGKPAHLASASEATARSRGRSLVAVSVYELTFAHGRPRGRLLCISSHRGAAGVALVPAQISPTGDYRRILGRVAQPFAEESGAAYDPGGTGGACVY
jgi:hypothetical protein